MLVATASCCEDALCRAGEPNVTIAETGEQGSVRMAFFDDVGKKISRSKADFAPAWSR